jgi:hypothetical protein
MRFAHFSHHDSYLAGRSGAREGIWRRRREGDLLRNDINPVRGEAACEEGAGHLLRDNINPVRGGAAREDVV